MHNSRWPCKESIRQFFSSVGNTVVMILRSTNITCSWGLVFKQWWCRRFKYKWTTIGSNTVSWARNSANSHSNRKVICLARNRRCQMKWISCARMCPGTADPLHQAKHVSLNVPSTDFAGQQVMWSLLPDSAPGNLQGTSLEVGKPSFPCLTCPRDLRGASLEVGTARQVLPWPEGPNSVQGFLEHGGMSPSNLKNACSGWLESVGISRLPILSCNKANRCLPQRRGTNYYHFLVQPHIWAFIGWQRFMAAQRWQKVMSVSTLCDYFLVANTHSHRKILIIYSRKYTRKADSKPVYVSAHTRILIHTENKIIQCNIHAQNSSRQPQFWIWNIFNKLLSNVLFWLMNPFENFVCVCRQFTKKSKFIAKLL